jgi:hypothetical protein
VFGLGVGPLSIAQGAIIVRFFRSRGHMAASGWTLILISRTTHMSTLEERQVPP